MTRQALSRTIGDRYRVEAKLGSGGAATVYRCLDERSGRVVAVKVLTQPLESEQARRRFDRETSALRRLARIDGVVQVQDHGIDGDEGWIVMNVHDTSLGARLASTGPLPVAEAVTYGRALAATLDRIHDAGVVHGDMKPSNVFLDRSGAALLGDFGAATFEIEPTLTGPAPLSLAWVAPETIETGSTSPASDLYGLGAVLYAMLSGTSPHRLEDDGQVLPIGPALRVISTGRHRPLDESIPADLRTLVDDLLASDPASRPTDAAKVVERLAAIDGAVTSTVANSAPATPTDRSPGQRRARPQLIVAGVVLIAGLAFALLLWANRSDDPTTVATSAPAPVPTSAPTPTQPATDGPVPLGAESVQWSSGGETSLASVQLVDAERGPTVRVVPGVGGPGGAWIERTLPQFENTELLSLQMQVLVEPAELQRGERSWIQRIARVNDEAGREWSVNLTAYDGELRYNAGYWDANADDGGGDGAIDTVQPGVWHCVELRLDRNGPAPLELLVDGQSVISIDDPSAAERGNGYQLALGAVWVEEVDLAPVVNLAEIAVADQPGIC